nr:hypothetical protein [Tanacetum cinerariifolium]
ETSIQQMSSGKEESKPRIDKKFLDTIQIDHKDEYGGDDEDDLKHVPLSKRYQVEARLVEFKTQEVKFCEKIRGLEFDVKRSDKNKNCLGYSAVPPPAQVYSPLKKDMS